MKEGRKGQHEGLKKLYIVDNLGLILVVDKDKVLIHKVFKNMGTCFLPKNGVTIVLQELSRNFQGLPDPMDRKWWEGFNPFGFGKASF